MSSPGHKEDYRSTDERKDALFFRIVFLILCIIILLGVAKKTRGADTCYQVDTTDDMTPNERTALRFFDSAQCIPKTFAASDSTIFWYEWDLNDVGIEVLLRNNLPKSVWRRWYDTTPIPCRWNQIDSLKSQLTSPVEVLDPKWFKACPCPKCGE